MGGRIEVASEHGHGSTFRFFIESRTAKTQIPYETESVTPAAKKSGGKAKRQILGPKPHVLIVEDNLINQTVLMRQLKHVGLTCDGESHWNAKR
jgi:hypothetical protein